MSGKRPKRLGSVIRGISEDVAPKTPLASAQSAWAVAAGPQFAGRCEPISERDGILTVACESAVWAAELDLRQAEIVNRLRAEAGLSQLRSLRVQTSGAR